ncbi:MAG: hypothetical protein FD187_3176 [bacterium]|nr:MAG: hypothetical protein FD187_3176 [bacterium]
MKKLFNVLFAVILVLGITLANAPQSAAAILLEPPPVTPGIAERLMGMGKPERARR